MNLRKKRALVLGVSGGLGGAIARALAAEGATVIGASRHAPSQDSGLTEHWQSLDLAQRESVDALCDQLLAEGGVDIVVNNSGGPPPGEAKGQAYQDWITQFTTMAASLFHLTGRLLPPMAERGWGRVLTVGSSGIEQPIPRLALSNSIRGSLLGWSKTLSNEVAKDGITVNMILPGRIETGRVGEIDAATAERQGISLEQVQTNSRATIPLGRYGRPEEFAQVATFLVSECASYITGSVVRVDGGLIRSV